MIAVLGSEFDGSARELVDAWAGEGGVLVSARDLCTRGWVHFANSPGSESFVAAGVTRSASGLRGVVVRRPAVAAEELPWIASDDRAYVAAEINAFLVAWLSALPCPVLNRPTATSLCGAGWSQIQWRLEAARAGVEWADPADEDAVQDVVFCRGLQYGAGSSRQVRVGRTLARVSGAELFGVRFRHDAVAAVTLQPRLSEPGARATVLAQFGTEAVA